MHDFPAGPGLMLVGGIGVLVALLRPQAMIGYPGLSNERRRTVGLIAGSVIFLAGLVILVAR
jgi:hypothetical protein